jgi:hypothetical protein
MVFPIIKPYQHTHYLTGNRKPCGYHSHCRIEKNVDFYPLLWFQFHPNQS